MELALPSRQHSDEYTVGFGFCLSSDEHFRQAE